MCILLSTWCLVSEKALDQDKALLAKTADYREVKVITSVYDTAHNCPVVVVAASSDSERESVWKSQRDFFFFNSKKIPVTQTHNTQRKL